MKSSESLKACLLQSKHVLYKRISSRSKILAVSGGYLARLIWACSELYHSCKLLVPCLKLVNRSKWTLTSFDCGLQNSSNFPQIVSKVSSSPGKHHETYWSMPKSPLQATTFLHCCCSGKAASSHSRIFLHFKHHFKTYGKAHHLLSSSLWNLQCMEWTCLELVGVV